jgi:hypothetical protein
MFGNPPPPPPPRQLPPAKADKKLMGTLEPVGPKVVLKNEEEEKKAAIDSIFTIPAPPQKDASETHVAPKQGLFSRLGMHGKEDAPKDTAKPQAKLTAETAPPPEVNFENLSMAEKRMIAGGMFSGVVTGASPTKESIATPSKTSLVGTSKQTTEAVKGPQRLDPKELAAAVSRRGASTLPAESTLPDNKTSKATTSTLLNAFGIGGPKR